MLCKLTANQSLDKVTQSRCVPSTKRSSSNCFPRAARHGYPREFKRIFGGPSRSRLFGTRIQSMSGVATVPTQPSSHYLEQLHVLIDTEYAKDSAKIIELSNELRALNVDSDIQLPTLVVAGNQSSGKSSLVEAIANVSLPRASGTCTRCPTDVRLMRRRAPGGHWQAEVKLKYQFDDKGNELKQQTEEVLAIVTKPSQIATTVSVAQLLLLLDPDQKLKQLNVGTSSSKAEHDVSRYAPSFDTDGKARMSELFTTAFGASSIEEVLQTKKGELGFTRNSVVIEISGAEVDLSIIDLPGLISQFEGSTLISNMVKDTLKQDNVIIVAAISGTDDIENQGVVALARELDPRGARTIGVITKTDRIEEGNRNTWLGYMRDESSKHHLQRGYFMVFNPTPEQLQEGISFEAARKNEEEFFEEAARDWLDPATARERAGVKALRNALSSMLITSVKSQLPAIMKNTESKLAAVRKQLDALPLAIPPERADAELSKRLYRLARVLEQLATGDGDDMQLYQEMNECYKKMRDTMGELMPAFIVNDAVVIGARWIGDRQDGKTVDIDGREHVFTFKDVEVIHTNQRGRELPGFVPYKAVEMLMKQCREGWAQAAADCVREVEEKLEERTDSAVEEQFSDVPVANKLIKAKAREYIQQLSNEMHTRVMELIHMEHNDIFTLHDKTFMHMQSINLQQLRLAYRNKDVSVAEDDVLRMMAAALAYFSLVYWRLTDCLALHIREDLLRKFADHEHLPDRLRQMLNSGKIVHKASELMAGDREQVKQRQEKTQVATKLEQALELIQEYMIQQ